MKKGSLKLVDGSNKLSGKFFNLKSQTFNFLILHPIPQEVFYILLLFLLQK